MKDRPKRKTAAGRKEMTGEELAVLLRRKPDWAKKLHENPKTRGTTVEITTFANLDGSPVTHLPPELTFVGRDEHGNCASLRGCRNLQTIQSRFNGKLDCGPLEIDGRLVPCAVRQMQAQINQPNNNGEALDLSHNQNVEFLSGAFPGSVNLDHSWVKGVDLQISERNSHGTGLSMRYCQTKPVRSIKGVIRGAVDVSGTTIERWGPLRNNVNSYRVRTHLAGASIRSIDPGSSLTRATSLGADPKTELQLHAHELTNSLRHRFPEAINPEDGRVELTGKEDICPEIVEAALILMEGSQLENRTAGKGQLSPEQYSFLSKAARKWVDLTNGGLTPLGKASFPGTDYFEKNRERFETAEKLHREYASLRHRLRGVIHDKMPADDEIKKFYDPKTNQLTKLGERVFTKDVLCDRQENKAARLAEYTRTMRMRMQVGAIKDRFLSKTALKAALYSSIVATGLTLGGYITSAIVERTVNKALDGKPAAIQETADEISRSSQNLFNSLWKSLDTKTPEKSVSMAESKKAAEAIAMLILEGNPKPSQVAAKLNELSKRADVSHAELLGTLAAWQVADQEWSHTPSANKLKPIQKDMLRNALLECSSLADPNSKAQVSAIQGKIQRSLEPAPAPVKPELAMQPNP